MARPLPKIFAGLVLASLAGVLFVRCGRGLDTLGPGGTSASVLAISPTGTLVGFGRTRTFTAAGGSAPYVFSLPDSNAGSFLSAVFTASSVAGTYVVRATDSAGLTADAQARVVPITSWIGRIDAGSPALTGACIGATLGIATPAWCTGGLSAQADVFAAEGDLDVSGNTASDDQYLYAVSENTYRVQRYDRKTGAKAGWIGKIHQAPSGPSAACSSATLHSVTPGWCTGGLPESGSSSGKDGVVNAYSAIAVAGDSLYVGDYTGGRIQRFDKASGALTGWIGYDTNASAETSGWSTSTDNSSQNIAAAAVGGPQYLFVSAGKLYVSDGYNGRINVYDLSSGAFLFKLADVAGGPAGLASDGTWLYVAVYDHRIRRYKLADNSDGGWIGMKGSGPLAGDPGCSSLNNGQFTPGWCTGGAPTNGGASTSGFNSPEGLVFDGTYLIVADSGNNRVSRYLASNGSFSGWIGAVNGTPTGGDTPLCSSASGFTPGWCTGGTPNGATSSGDGHFNVPVGLSLGPDGELYVSDSVNYRIQRWVF